MKAIKGPAVFLAQFAGDAPPFNSLPAIADWAARLGFKGVQIPSWDRRLFDLEKAAESQTYSDEVRRWRPILDVFEDEGVNACFEIHPGEDLHDGVTFEMFLDRVGGHKRCNILYDPSHFVLQQLDYLEYIDIYHERIRMFHVKDAEFNPTGRQGVY